MTVAERMADLSYRFYGAIRDGGAWQLAEGPAEASDFDHLRGHKYGLLITYRRNGEGVPTPIWFGLRDGRAYLRTEKRTAKVTRIRANPRVRLAPCTMRAKPRGPVAEGRARILPHEEEQRAEEAIQSNYGLGRRIYEAPVDRSSIELVYIEVSPTASDRVGNKGTT